MFKQEVCLSSIRFLLFQITFHVGSKTASMMLMVAESVISSTTELLPHTVKMMLLPVHIMHNFWYEEFCLRGCVTDYANLSGKQSAKKQHDDMVVVFVND